MNLLELRRKFIAATGRFNLATTVSESYDTDDGADFFIQQGQEYLENELDIKEHSLIRKIIAIESDNYRVNLDNSSAGASSDIDNFFKTISKANLYDYSSTTGPMYLGELEYKPWDWIIENYPDMAYEDTGTPLYWSHAPAAPSASTAITNLNAPAAMMIPYIVIMPPTNTSGRYVEFFGTGRGKTLSSNTDTNSWSTYYPMVLLAAAKYQYHVFYGNVDAAKFAKTALDDLITNVDKNRIEDQITKMGEIVT